MEWIQSVDFAILDGIQSVMRCDFWDVVMKVLSYLGEAGALWIVLSIVLLFSRKTRVAGVAMLVSMALGFLIGDLAIKHLVCRPRPCMLHPLANMNISPPSSFSFPSGHSTAGFAAAVSLTIWQRKWGIPALVVAAAIAFSRLYNYVHFPSDVICGMILGTACAFFVAWAFRKTGFANRLGGIPKAEGK